MVARDPGFGGVSVTVPANSLFKGLGSERKRHAKATSLQCYSGIAPVTKQSGGTERVQRRYRCPKFLKQTFHEFANESILHSRWAAAYYQQQREKKAGHHKAVRALAGSVSENSVRACFRGKGPMICLDFVPQGYSMTSGRSFPPSSSTSTSS